MLLRTFLIDASHTRKMTGNSKSAGTLKSVATLNVIPAVTSIGGVTFFEKRIINPRMIGPVIRSSAFTVRPSHSGRVVSAAKVECCKFLYEIFFWIEFFC